MRSARGKLIVDLFKGTAQEWIDDDAPQLGAALAYYSVFSLAPMVLLLVTVIGVLFRSDPAGAWSTITQQMSYFLDRSAVQMVQQIARQVSTPAKTTLGGVIGFALALFGATGVFGQLQNALNIIWGVKAKPGGSIWGFVRSRFLSFALLAGLGFLMLISLVIETVIKAFSHYLQTITLRKSCFSAPNSRKFTLAPAAPTSNPTSTPCGSNAKKSKNRRPLEMVRFRNAFDLLIWNN